jgi:riboflavin biosynthesis pyrimidine reductase
MLADAPACPVIVTCHDSPRDRREALSAVANVLVCGETDVDLRAAVTTLAEMGYPQLLSEGGPLLFGSLTAADLVDEMCLTVAPKLAGPGAGRITAGPGSSVRDLALLQILSAADELLLRYARQL